MRDAIVMGARIAYWRGLTLVLFITLLAGCSNLPRTQFTAQDEGIAQIPGIPGARFWADAAPSDLRLALHLEPMRAFGRRTGSMNLLALSGGASDGAFGAGVLAGMTAAGTRPQFTMVSGVSAGALIAPLAFLGTDEDKLLAAAFTDGRAEPVGEGGLFSILFSQESRRAALYDLVASIVDERLLRRIAEEHARGRRLFVVSTNLDAQRPVVWDMGVIASSRAPGALKLFRDVLVASSSVPGAFAPTLIEVEANGHQFAELHVDGGATTQVFIVPESLLAAGAIDDLPARKVPAQLYVIINNRLTPDFEVVEGATLPVLGRSLSTLIKTHSRLTLVATEEFARNQHIGFNLTYIADDFPREPKPSFETAYMRSVYDYGYQKAQSGHLWANSIPFPAPAARQLLVSRR
jgi:predicted acylesterase/phospholipase RssA